jgi:hypothetical protein
MMGAGIRVGEIGGRILVLPPIMSAVAEGAREMEMLEITTAGPPGMSV